MANFIRDELTGLPKIENEESINLMLRPSLAEYKEIPVLEEEFLFKEVRVKRRGNQLNPGSVKKIKAKYPNLFPDIRLEYDIPLIPDEDKPIKLPKNTHDLILFYKAILHNKNFSLNTSAELIPYWLSLFCIYGDEFCATYDEYIIEPDLSVTTITGDIKDYIRENLKVEERQKPFNTNDIKSTCHLILISMNKVFALGPTERDRQMRTYIANRKSAVYASMGVQIGDLLFKDDFIVEISEIFKLLPKLKRTLFFYCYLNQTIPEFSTAIVLLSHTSMTTIKAMLDFINQKERTLAHCEPVILEEVAKFIRVTKKKKQEDGALWPYHRVLYPTDGDLNAANFPNLAVCSVEYLKKYGSPTYQFMVTPTVPCIPGIREKATMIDTREIYTQKASALSGEALEGAKELGLDVNKLMATNRGLESAQLDPNELMTMLTSILSGKKT